MQQLQSIRLNSRRLKKKEKNFLVLSDLRAGKSLGLGGQGVHVGRRGPKAEGPLSSLQDGSMAFVYSWL